MAVDGSGNVFIADYSTNRVREVQKATSTIFTFAGNGTAGFTGDGGFAGNAELSGPRGVAVDASGITPDVHTLARAVDEHYNHLRTLEAEFTEVYRGAGIERTEAGTLWLKKPGKMRWEYRSPREKLFVSDGHEAWFYVADDRQARKTPVSKLDDIRSPLALLLGKTKLEKELRGLSLAPDVPASDPAGVVLRGVPQALADRMNEILPRCSERAGLTTTKAFSIRYLARPLKASAGVPAQADPVALEHNAQLLANSMDLARLWSNEESEWQCRTRDGAFGATLSADGSAGTISAYVIPSSGEPQTVCGIVDDVLWGDLHDAARRELVQLLMQAAAAKGASLVLLPMLEYSDLSPFRDAGFRLTRRTLHMYLTVWKPGLQIEPLRSAYMDVF